MDVVGLIKKHLNIRFRELQTAEVVIVEAVDYTTWTCSVRPKARVDVHGVVQEMPVIMGVPIIVQKAGGSSILMPIKVHDVGTAVFSKHALDNILIDKSTVAISIPRSFDINDAIYIGGNFVESDTIPPVSEGELLIYHHTGAHIKFDNNGNVEIRANRIDFTEL